MTIGVKGVRALRGSLGEVLFQFMTNAVHICPNDCSWYENDNSGHQYDHRSQGGTYIKGLFWPPLEPKTENCFSPISFDWFIRRITEV